MKPSSKVFMNENYCDLILKYLSNNDIINFSSANKKISQYANKAINDICVQYFSPSCDEYSLLQNCNDNSIDDNDSFLNNINIFNWKKILVSGKQIQFLYSTLNMEHFTYFRDDCEKVEKEIYNSLKECYSLQPIRKSNLYLESDLNSNHQTFLFDFLYDTQDLYDYYSNTFFSKCKFEDGVFSKCLNNYYSLNLFQDILDNNSQYEVFQDLRFYCFSFDSLIMLDQSYDSMLNFVSNYRYLFINHVEKIRANTYNPLLNLLDYIYLTVSYFCMITFCDISKYKEETFLFLNALLKKYKAFIESAIKINKYLENLNVLVNLIYEKKNSKHYNPRFSIYRMMLILFNRLVIHPLMEEKNEYNCIELTVKIFNAYLRTELKKICEEKEKEDGTLYSSENETTSDLSLLSTFQNPINLYKGTEVDKLEGSENSESDTNGQIEMFIEQIALLLVDQISNEYSVFYLNSSEFPITSYYQILEKRLLDVISEATKDYIEKKRNTKELLDFFLFFRDNDFLNTRFINVTKVKIANHIADIVYSEAKKELIEIFEKYLKEYQPNQRTLLKKPKYQKFPFYFDLKNYASNKNHFNNIEEVVFSFFEFYTKTLNYQLIIDIYDWISKINIEQERTDEIIHQETIRRNILLDKQIYNAQFWNYNMSHTTKEILSLMKLTT